MSLRALHCEMRMDGRTLLSDVSVEVRPGEVLAVVGPNGAGKTTLLRLLSGEWRPTSGAVELDGRELADWEPKARARRLAVLPQASSLGFPFRVEEVVELGRAPHGGQSRRGGERRIIARAMELAGVSGMERRVYTTLSGGERQRVHLARVLAQVMEGGPAHPILLLDEPTSALDLAHQQGILALAGKLAARGFAVLVVLHDLNLAARYADRVLVMRRGRVYREGPPGEVLTRDVIRVVYHVETLIHAHPVHQCPLVVPVA